MELQLKIMFIGVCVCLTVFIVTGCFNVQQELDAMVSEDCFSKENFNLVSIYLEKEIENSSQGYYLCKGYELSFNKEKSIIAVKKKGYTLAVIDREKGIYSLNISSKHNERMVRKATVIFCNLLKQGTK